MSSRDRKIIDSYVRAFMKKYELPGLSLAVTKDERLVFAQGYGVSNKATNWHTSPKHLMRIASISKPITAAAILKLYETTEGYLIKRFSVRERSWG